MLLSSNVALTVTPLRLCLCLCLLCHPCILRISSQNVRVTDKKYIKEGSWHVAFLHLDCNGAQGRPADDGPAKFCARTGNEGICILLCNYIESCDRRSQ